MRPPAVTLAVVAVLVLPAAAGAKEISSVTLCGAGGKCATLDREHDGDLMALAESATEAEAPGKAAPFYRVRFGIREPGTRHEDHWTVAWVPSLGLLGSGDGPGSWMWSTAGAEQAARLRGLADRIDPLPAQRLRGWQAPVARVDESFTPAGAGTPWPPIAGAAALLALTALGLSARSRTTRTSGRRAPRPSGRRSA